MKNPNATRTFSDKHEKSVCKALNAVQNSNSGAGYWRKGDVINKEAELLIECKCSMSEKESFSVKHEWLKKNEEERRLMGLENGSLCFNFGPDTPNYYIINEKLMQYLTNCLTEEYKELILPE